MEPPQTMKAALVTAYNEPLIVKDVATPEPGPGQILVRVKASSLCMSDIGGYVGAMGEFITLPYCPGHEPAGEIVALGDNVSGFSVGDRVTYMAALDPCMGCRDCLRGAIRFCSKRSNLGFSHQYGGFSEYSLASPYSMAKVPDELSLEEAASMSCAGVTAFGALKLLSKYQAPGGIINVLGCGGVGHLVIKFAVALGYTVHAFDINDGKLKLAEECGASKAFLSKGDPTQAMMAESTIVISGVNAAYDFAIKATLAGGRIIAIGHPHSATPMPLGSMIINDISLIVSNQGTRVDLQEALDFAARSGVRPNITINEGLDGINQGYKSVMTGAVEGRLVYKF